MSINITRYDGTKVPFNADKINRSIERACQGLFDPVSKVTQIATETRLTLYDGITTDELDQATINAAVQNIKDDIEYDKVATRLLLKTIYRKVLGEYDKEDSLDLAKKHRDGFIRYIKEGIESKRLDPKMAERFDVETLADTLNIERDELFTFAGLDGLIKRYSIRKGEETTESPQYFFMRIAMGLSYNEKNPTEAAKKFYNKMSRMEYIPGGSTNLAAGTINPPLSNCFLMEVQDDMENISKSVADVMLLSKASGGLGVSMTKLRASGSVLMSNNGISSGPTPFAKIMDTAIRAIIRGGKKKGALCFYMENWHHDFLEFLDWKQNGGDDYMRMRTANTSVFMSDEFMTRVKAGAEWYLFDPKETSDLTELYGKAFSKRYAEYIELAEAGKIKMWRKIPAAELYRKILVSLQTTSHPWLTWKDTINVRALNNNTGTIHMSNLCTEICLPQDRDNVAVCNLASINLSVHVKNKEINWARLEESVRLAVRQLDNLIDINVLPIKEAAKSDRENRAIGLGVMGFADTLEQLGMAYDSQHAANFADRIFEFISYMAIDESANLAQERGSYMNFQGSRWSKGMVPIDTLTKVEEDRGELLTVDKSSHHKGLNWDILRAKVAKGMRNSTLMAIAPTANIGLLAGVTPGIDVRFAQIFSRNKFSGKYVDINHNLVKDLKNLGIWEQVKDAIIENQGDIADIEGIPQHMKEVYKTSFSTSPYAVIEIAARAQKWIDQALSRNMYLETRDIDETMKIYQTAWEKGVKTTYYLHVKPRHTAEQSTTNVNKAAQIGKLGFGALNLSTSAAFSAPLQKSLDIQMPVESPVEIPTPVPTTETILATSVVAKEIMPEVEAKIETVTEIKSDIKIENKLENKIESRVPIHEPVMVAAHTTPSSIGVNSTLNQSNNINNNPNNIIAPEDPADNENNVCIACQ
jgi:ribonucleoside-diphosphate reductase alpha chain